MFNKKRMPPIFFSTIVCYFVKTIWYKFINHLCEGNEIFQILDRGRNTRANLFTRNGLNFTYSNYGCAVGTTFEWGTWLYQVNFDINIIKQLILVLKLNPELKRYLKTFENRIAWLNISCRFFLKQKRLLMASRRPVALLRC